MAQGRESSLITRLAWRFLSGSYALNIASKAGKQRTRSGATRV